jgi:hypothetical protein
MLKGEIQRKTMQLPGQIVEEKKQQQHSEMDAISKSVTISCCFFFARARSTLEISGVALLSLFPM